MLIAAKFSPNASLVCFPLFVAAIAESPAQGWGSGWASQEAGVPPCALRVLPEPCQKALACSYPGQAALKPPQSMHCSTKSILLFHTADGPRCGSHHLFPGL